MADVVKLRAVRKARERADRERTAAANRSKHGRTKDQKLADRAEQARQARDLDGARREPKPAAE